MATVKISDLSVGDWVRYKGEECTIAAIYMAAEGYPHEVALTRQGICCGCPYVDDLEPIPITPEILKANGFFHNGKKWYTPELFTLERYPNVWTIVIECTCGEYVCEVYTIKYVHQLQHALRLVGVEKEIVMPNK